MFSVYIFTVGALLSWVFTGCLLGFGARILGSVRGRVGVGIAVVFIVDAIQMVLLAPTLALTGQPALKGLATIATLIVQIWVTFVVFKLGFRLSAGRVWALFGIYVAWLVMELIFALLIFRPYIVEACPRPSNRETVSPWKSYFIRDDGILSRIDTSRTMDERRCIANGWLACRASACDLKTVQFMSTIRQ
jgi:hypothetical protein